MLNGIKNVLLWSYARGTWQYDLLCVLIIIGLFVWPEYRPASAQPARTATSAVGLAN